MRMTSHIGSVIRGSVGGITYTANQFQNIICRARVSPVNPNTSYQSAIRSAFSGAEELWEGLTDTVRTAWNDYASSLVFTGPTGNYSVPGRQVFIANIGTATYLNSRLSCFVSVATTAPTIPGFLNIENVVAAAPAAPSTGFDVNADYNGTEDVTVFASRSVAFNASRNRHKGPFVSSTLAYDNITSPGTGNIPFAELSADFAYFAKVRAITTAAPFRLSAAFFVRAIAEVTSP